MNSSPLCTPLCLFAEGGGGGISCQRCRIGQNQIQAMLPLQQTAEVKSCRFSVINRQEGKQRLTCPISPDSLENSPPRATGITWINVFVWFWELKKSVQTIFIYWYRYSDTCVRGTAFWPGLHHIILQLLCTTHTHPLKSDQIHEFIVFSCPFWHLHSAFSTGQKRNGEKRINYPSLSLCVIILYCQWFEAIVSVVLSCHCFYTIVIVLYLNTKWSNTNTDIFVLRLR